MLTLLRREFLMQTFNIMRFYSIYITLTYVRMETFVLVFNFILSLKKISLARKYFNLNKFIYNCCTCKLPLDSKKCSVALLMSLNSRRAIFKRMLRIY